MSLHFQGFFVVIHWVHKFVIEAIGSCEFPSPERPCGADPGEGALGADRPDQLQAQSFSFPRLKSDHAGDRSYD